MHVQRYAADRPLDELVAGLRERPGLCFLDGGDSSPSFLASDPVQRVVRDGMHSAPLSALSELADPAPARDAVPSPDPSAGLSLSLSPEQLPRWAGYIAYDAHLPTTFGKPRGDSRPVLCFHRYDAWLAVDPHSGQRWLVGDDAEGCNQLALRLQHAEDASTPRAVLGGWAGSSGRAHREAVERALQHISAGDIYQVNLARHYDAALRGDPLALARAMARQGEVAFGFYFDEGERQIIGRSMERFLRWDRATGAVHSAPIKGTLARDGSRDSADATALRADPKEQAEHAMIVDLMRNDLGRIATTGSVRVTDLMRVEPYAHLAHLVSTVRCQASAELDLCTLLEATFPPGSVTGTPKLRALSIIEELEPVARGVYTGAYGFVDRLGGCSLSVAIRTAVVQDQAVRYHAGGGIVAASDPARELLETQLKAKGFVAAVDALRPSPQPSAGSELPAPGELG